MAIYKEEYSPNYTVVGSPTISDSFILSGISNSSYVTRALPDSYEGTNKVILMCTQTTQQATNWVLSSGYNYHVGFDASGKIYMYCSNRDGTVDGTNMYGINQKVWLCLVSTAGVSAQNRTATLYSLEDSGYNLNTLPPLSAWRTELTANIGHDLFSRDTLYIGVNSAYTAQYFKGTVDLTTVAFYNNDVLVWEAVNKSPVDVSGSVEISSGYYSDGLNKITMPASKYNIDTLAANQTIGGRNKLFAYTDSTDSVGALITSATPTGSFKITKELAKPVYLDPTKNYIAGGELIEPKISFTSGAGELWVRPNLTSATSYGTVSNVYNTDGSWANAPWKALDGDSSTFALLTDGSGGVFWWKWELPHDIVFTSESVLTFVQRNSSEGCGGWRFYADVERTKPLGETFSTDGLSAGRSLTIPCTNLTSNISTNIVYLYNPSVGSWPGMSELQFTNVYASGEPLVSYTKALQYSEAQDTTYWIPSKGEVSLESVKATQSVGPVNDLYLITTAGTPTASLSFSNNGEIVGAATKLPLKQKVYLNNETDKILGVQERPKGIIMNKADGELAVEVVGNPTISDQKVVSGFSSGNYIQFQSPVVATDVCEIVVQVTTGSTIPSTDLPIFTFLKKGDIFLEGSSKKFCQWDGSYKVSGITTVTTNTTYVLRLTRDGSNTKLYVNDALQFTTDRNIIQDSLIQLGKWDEQYFNGSIDLRRCYILKDGQEVWRALQNISSIYAIGWDTLYCGITGRKGYFSNSEYAKGQDISLSSIFSETPATKVHPLWITEDSIVSADSITTEKAAFSGYTLTLSDTLDSVESISRTGALSKVYYNGTNTFVVVLTELKEGTNSSAIATAVKDMSTPGALPPSSYTIQNRIFVEYDSANDTIAIGGTTLNFFGELMVDLDV